MENIMPVPAALGTVAADLTTFETQLKTDFGTLSSDAKTNLSKAFSDAETEGGTVWTAIKTALGIAATPAPAAFKQ